MSNWKSKVGDYPKSAATVGVGVAGAGIIGAYKMIMRNQRFKASKRAMQAILKAVSNDSDAAPVSCDDILKAVRWHVDNKVKLDPDFYARADGAMCATTPPEKVDETLGIVELGQEEIRAYLDANGIELPQADEKEKQPKRKSTRSRSRSKSKASSAAAADEAAEADEADEADEVDEGKPKSKPKRPSSRSRSRSGKRKSSKGK
jgi:hypothetical protein